MTNDTELREKIAEILAPVIIQYDEGDPLKFADAILAIPEIASGGDQTILIRDEIARRRNAAIQLRSQCRAEGDTLQAYEATGVALELGDLLVFIDAQNLSGRGGYGLGNQEIAAMQDRIVDRYFELDGYDGLFHDLLSFFERLMKVATEPSKK